MIEYETVTSNIRSVTALMRSALIELVAESPEPLTEAESLFRPAPGPLPGRHYPYRAENAKKATLRLAASLYTVPRYDDNIRVWAIDPNYDGSNAATGSDSE